MKYVYVINKNGNPLMPCKPAKAKHLLKDGKARVVRLNPFTIQLLWYCEENIQEVVVGLDTGANRVGCSAVTKDGKVLYQSETILRDDISKKMTQRREYRRTRRYRKTRYRKPRFLNRRRPKGWLPPSLKSKADSTVKVVTKLSEILPFKKVRVEVAKFDIQKLKNPNISGVQYQRGALYQYHNVRNYVFTRDGYACQICKKKGGILVTHHLTTSKKVKAEVIYQIT